MQSFKIHWNVEQMLAILATRCYTMCQIAQSCVNCARHTSAEGTISTWIHQFYPHTLSSIISFTIYNTPPPHSFYPSILHSRMQNSACLDHSELPHKPGVSHVGSFHAISANPQCTYHITSHSLSSAHHPQVLSHHCIMPLCSASHMPWHQAMYWHVASSVWWPLIPPTP